MEDICELKVERNLSSGSNSLGRFSRSKVLSSETDCNEGRLAAAATNEARKFPKPVRPNNKPSVAVS